MEWRQNGTPDAIADFGTVTAGQTAPEQTFDLVNTDTVAHSVKLRLTQAPGGAAGAGTASVQLPGGLTPLAGEWLDCGTLAPGAALTVTVGWFTADGAAADAYTAEDLAFVDAQYV